MRSGRLFALFCGLAALAVALPARAATAQAPAPVPTPAPTPAAADLVLRGGAVYTMDGARSWAQAVAIRGGRLAFVGSDHDVAPYVGSSTKVIELAGRMVLPSFRDSHVHPIEGGVARGRCVLDDAETPAQVYDTLRRCIAASPGAGWLLGGGWQLPAFPAANPSRTDLDAIVGERPAFLEAADGHSAWASSAALRLAGVTRATPDPPNGRIERDAGGAPSGTLREAAKMLVAAVIPPPGEAERRAGLRRALALAASLGITTLNEANADEADLATYAAAERDGELSARVVVSLHLDPAKDDAEIDRLAALRDRYRSARLSAPAVKIFADGVIESGTAALLAPYLGRGESRGDLELTPERFAHLATLLDARGFQIHVHAIGDRAIRVTLDALEAAQRANGRRDARHQIAHLELIDPADIPRFARLGVLADFQPLWAYRDSYIRDLTEPVLGPERSRWLYPIGSVLRTGAVVVAGSDWNVSSMNPLEAIQVAITRRDPAAPAGAPWIPEETAGLTDMLAAYTIRGAYLNAEEATTGSLETGKSADLIVVDHDLFAIAPEQIHAVKVLLTLLEGRETYRAPGF